MRFERQGPEDDTHQVLARRHRQHPLPPHRLMLLKGLFEMCFSAIKNNRSCWMMRGGLRPGERLPPGARQPDRRRAFFPLQEEGRGQTRCPHGNKLGQPKRLQTKHIRKITMKYRRQTGSRFLDGLQDLCCCPLAVMTY